MYAIACLCLASNSAIALFFSCLNSSFCFLNAASSLSIPVAFACRSFTTLACSFSSSSFSLLLISSSRAFRALTNLSELRLLSSLLSLSSRPSSEFKIPLIASN